MSICALHQHTLIRELKRKGIYYLCATDERVINQRMGKWIHGASQRQDFDPLVVCRMEIHAKARRMLGDQLSIADCPLCAAAAKIGKDTDAIWVSGFTDLMLATAKQNEFPIRSTH